jgi:hypothetical protein
VNAYKFLQAGSVGRFSGRAWPPPGAWLSAGAAIDLCRSGVHACRAGDLPHWLDDELWQVELAGDVTQAEQLVVASRARLVARVAGWNPDTAKRFAVACAERAQDYARLALERRRPAAPAAAAAAASSAGHAQLYADAREAISFAAFAAYSAAVAAGHLDPDGGTVRERERQAAWLVDACELDSSPPV